MKIPSSCNCPVGQKLFNLKYKTMKYEVASDCGLGKKPPQKLYFKQGLAVPLFHLGSLFAFYCLLRFRLHLDLCSLWLAWFWSCGVSHFPCNHFNPFSYANRFFSCWEWWKLATLINHSACWMPRVHLCLELSHCQQLGTTWWETVLSISLFYICGQIDLQQGREDVRLGNVKGPVKIINDRQEDSSEDIKVHQILRFSQIYTSTSMRFWKNVLHGFMVQCVHWR